MMHTQATTGNGGRGRHAAPKVRGARAVRVGRLAAGAAALAIAGGAAAPAMADDGTGQGYGSGSGMASGSGSGHDGASWGTSYQPTSGGSGAATVHRKKHKKHTGTHRGHASHRDPVCAYGSGSTAHGTGSSPWMEGRPSGSGGGNGSGGGFGTGSASGSASGSEGGTGTGGHPEEGHAEDATESGGEGPLAVRARSAQPPGGGVKGVTVRQAVGAVLRGVPGGRVLVADRVRENGRWVWDTIVADRDGGRRIAVVDAERGKLLSVRRAPAEGPRAQAEIRAENRLAHRARTDAAAAVAAAQQREPGLAITRVALADDRGNPVWDVRAESADGTTARTVTVDATTGKVLSDRPDLDPDDA
ncbi:hypothetical protein BIV57_16785 [Mangrovactinospora gilvigrisea]|uniref:PepSY domain-containing protein n=1 Tax=Mangrovactinospora gilvigrisea TaxID=1428644 RepID=A0A1J7C9M4_9ACTN|nr:PepSY domain-containing protein [Mangrovactinospora gilvigrisea]OIV36346.1 hypothetical protein BIV57_16785 [Mangrovactinospora gilvigrisea]